MRLAYCIIYALPLSAELRGLSAGIYTRKQKRRDRMNRLAQTAENEWSWISDLTEYLDSEELALPFETIHPSFSPVHSELLQTSRKGGISSKSTNQSVSSKSRGRTRKSASSKSRSGKTKSKNNSKNKSKKGKGKGKGKKHKERKSEKDNIFERTQQPAVPQTTTSPNLIAHPTFSPGEHVTLQPTIFSIESSTQTPTNFETNDPTTTFDPFLRETLTPSQTIRVTPMPTEVESTNAPIISPTLILTREPISQPILTLIPFSTPSEGPTSAPSTTASSAPSQVPTSLQPTAAPFLVPLTTTPTVINIATNVPVTPLPSALPSVLPFSEAPSFVLPTGSPATRTPTLSPNITTFYPTNMPTGPTTTEIAIPTYFISYAAPLADREPTDDEYLLIAQLTTLYFEEVLAAIYNAIPDVQFLQVNTEIESVQFEAGIPDVQFNIYMVFKTTVAFGSTSEIPTQEDIFGIFQEAIGTSYIVNYVWQAPETPFISTQTSILMTVDDSQSMKATDILESLDDAVDAATLAVLESRSYLEGSKTVRDILLNSDHDGREI